MKLKLLELQNNDKEVKKLRAEKLLKSNEDIKKVLHY